MPGHAGHDEHFKKGDQNKMTDHQKVRKMLGILAGKRARLETTHDERAEARDKILTAEIQLALAAVDKRYADKDADLIKAIAELEDEIKETTLVIGETVKGGTLYAVWNSPRITWAKELEFFAKAHPEIEAFKKVGKASVSIRRAG